MAFSPSAAVMVAPGEDRGMSSRFDCGPRLPVGGRERLIGALTAAYFVALLVALPVGPVLVAAVTDLSLLSSVRSVVPAIGAAYIVGMALLLN